MEEIVLKKLKHNKKQEVSLKKGGRFIEERWKIHRRKSRLFAILVQDTG